MASASVSTQTTGQPTDSNMPRYALRVTTAAGSESWVMNATRALGRSGSRRIGVTGAVLKQDAEMVGQAGHGAGCQQLGVVDELDVGGVAARRKHDRQISRRPDASQRVVGPRRAERYQPGMEWRQPARASV